MMLEADKAELKAIQSFKDQMRITLNNGGRSYRHMMEIAEAADKEIARVKAIYDIVKSQLNKYQKLQDACIELKEDLLMRGRKEENEDGSSCTVVNVSQGRWYMFNKALNSLEE